MAAKRFLRLVSGRTQEILGIVVSAGAGNDGDIPALDATGRLDTSLMPVGIGPDVKILPSSENLAAGDYVNIWNDAGTLKVRKADAATAGKEADGYVLASVVSPANATVFFDAINTQLSALTLGAIYYLSAATPGAITVTPPAVAGNVVQELGKALSATELKSDLQGRGIVLV
jgi:hypothetical protein